MKFPKDKTYSWPQLWIFPQHTFDKPSTERRNMYVKLVTQIKSLKEVRNLKRE